MENILNQSETFEQLQEDPTFQKEDKLQKLLLRQNNIGFITENEYKFTRPVGSQPGRAYGLPKIHKENVPLRLIISACNTFNYKLSKLLARKLKHLRSGPNIVTDTFKFAEELYKLKLDEGRIKMISLDVTSLFTRVPLKQTIQLILEKIYGLQHNCPTSGKRRKD